MSQDLSLWFKKILVLVGVAGALYLIYTAASIVLILVISAFVTVLLNPLVEKGERYHIPVWLTVIIVYVIIFFLASIVVGNLVPIIIDYITSIIHLVMSWIDEAQNIYFTQGGLKGFHLNPYLEKVILLLFGEENINHTLDIIKQNIGTIQSFFTNQISSITSGGISVVSTVGGVVTDWTLIAVTTFLMVLERKDIGRFLLGVAPKSMSNYLHRHYIQIQHVGTAWIRGVLILCFGIFAMTYTGLLLVQFIFGIQIDQAFTLAIISGILEFIPYAGPIISFVLAIIIGLGVSWEAAFILGVLYFIVQQIEGNFLVPYVMSKSLDLSPFFVFIVMLVGATLGGILGIILAIPIAGVCKVIYVEYMKNRENGILSDPDMQTVPLPKKLIARNKNSKIVGQ